MPQRLPIALAQIKAGNTSENLLNEIRQIIYSLYRVKEITRKAQNNIKDSIKEKQKMDTVFKNSENNKASYPNRLILKLSDGIGLRKSDKYGAASNLSTCYAWKKTKR